MAARDLAITHTCMYDAWAAYDDRAVGTQLSGALRRPAAERTDANKEKAISYAAYRALSDLLPANGDHTMVTLWNPADEPQDYIFRLEFSGGHYSLPIHLEARATRMFNISDIIMTQVPDADGNIIPAAIQSGSAHIVGSQADNQSILLAIDSGVYNVRRATCYQQCTTCEGATSFWVDGNPFGVFIGGQQQEYFMDQWNTGAQYNLTSGSGWSSSNTNMATVQTGMVSGLASGSFTVTAGDGGIPLYANSCSPYNPCPINGGGSGSGTGNVNDPTPNITGISPSPWNAGTTTAVVITGTGFGTNPLLTIRDNYGDVSYSVTYMSNTEIDVNVTIAANDPGDNVTVTVTSQGYYGQPFQSTGGNSANSPNAQVAVNPIAAPTLSPGILYMSTGDTPAFQITSSPWVQLHPVYTSTLTANPYSTGAVTLSMADATGTGSVSNNVTASPAGSSGIFSVYAAVASTTTNTAQVVVPPQELIQVLWGEADIVSYKVETTTAQTLMEALGNAIGNRLGDSDDFAGVLSSSWQTAIAAPGQKQQFDGYNPGSQEIDNGVVPELAAAARVFSQAAPVVSVLGAQCFFSPDGPGWTAIQHAEASATVVPSVNHDPHCYALPGPDYTHEQFIIKTSAGTDPSSGIPFFIFVQKKASSDPAVITIQ